MALTFPTIVYRSPGPFVGPPVDDKSTTYATLGIEDASKLSAALDAGWCETLLEAVSPPAPAEIATPVASDPLDDPEALKAALIDAVLPPTRDELKAMAATLGLSYDGRISDAKLKALIDAALAAKE